eukprot:6409467-Prymnesium_polylepis.1
MARESLRKPWRKRAKKRAAEKENFALKRKASKKLRKWLETSAAFGKFAGGSCCEYSCTVYGTQ